MVVLNLAIFTTFDNDSYSVQRRYTRINLLLKPSSYAQFAPGCKFVPLASRSYANKLCPYVSSLTQGTEFY